MYQKHKRSYWPPLCFGHVFTSNRLQFIPKSENEKSMRNIDYSIQFFKMSLHSRFLSRSLVLSPICIFLSPFLSLILSCSFSLFHSNFKMRSQKYSQHKRSNIHSPFNRNQINIFKQFNLGNPLLFSLYAFDLHCVLSYLNVIDAYKSYFGLSETSRAGTKHERLKPNSCTR